MGFWDFKDSFSSFVLSARDRLKGLPYAPLPGHVEMAFENPQGGRLYSLSGQPVLVLGSLHSASDFLVSSWNFPCWSMCLSSCPCASPRRA